VSYAVGLALGRFLSGSPLLPGRGAGGEGQPLPGEAFPPSGKPLSRLHPLTPSPKTGEGGQENGSAPLSQLGRGAGGEGQPLPGEVCPPNPPPPKNNTR
jgi:hypothetical protein